MEHLLITHSGAIPNYLPESPTKSNVTEEDVIVVQKQLRQARMENKELKEKLEQTKKERDAYKMYVPGELLNYANLIEVIASSK
jgi:hypothetical protein